MILKKNNYENLLEYDFIYWYYVIFMLVNTLNLIKIRIIIIIYNDFILGQKTTKDYLWFYYSNY